ncbi:MAG: PhoH family protein [Myxococcota bacterium]|nr:PhoH family protein [Myxococcota bacterium]MEC8381802.1 PhoH family protein [Myxococcota bacterium]
MNSELRRTGRHTFVLDTNVLLFDPNAIQVFDEHDLMIPIVVIEEIDRFKKEMSEVGRNARTFSRLIDELRLKGSLSEGVELAGGGKIWIELVDSQQELPEGLTVQSNDNHILQMAYHHAKSYNEGEVILVSRDINMRIKADAIGLLAEDYANAHVSTEGIYTGVHTEDVPSDVIQDIYAKGAVEPIEYPLYPNQFVCFRNENNPKQGGLTRWKPSQRQLVKVDDRREGVWGIRARNKEQVFALDLLLDPDISVVTITGMAGTGKTLLAMAAGLKLVADEAKFRRLVVSRPIFPLGRDIGFLPGDISAKLNPWMQPIFDNLEFLLGERSDHRLPPSYESFIEQGIIEVEPLTYIRGRSIARQYFIVDEAQNLTPHEVKTVISRAGEGTKVILTGDPNQIDNPYIDATSNGLSYVVERFKESDVAGHIQLNKGERSKLAELAAKLL